MKRLLLLLLAGIFSAIFSPPRTARKSRSSGRESARSIPIESESRKPKPAKLKRWLLRFGLLLVVLGIGGFLIAVSGIIPIKASSGHWAITRWFLQFSKSRSVATHTIGMKAPPLDKPWMVLKGAGHYETGCAPCHGSPVHPQPRIAEHMLPRPPNLKFASGKWDATELFHIVKHGIKLTGMPAWPALQRDDEVWAMVAFLRELPELDATEYQRLTSGETQLSERAPMRDLLGLENTPRAVVESCARCHGVDGLGRGLGAFPKLAGQKHDYLLASLQAYAQGERHSGIMEPISAALNSENMEELARYYSNLPAKENSLNSKDVEAIERGKLIASNGIPSRGVPACVECHGHEPPRNPVYPTLHGQYADYLALQLELFSKEQRGGTPYSHLMHFVASRLTSEQMRDVVAYYSSSHQHHKHSEEKQ